MRTEMKSDDETLVEIVDPINGVSLLLDVKNHSYQEQAIPKLSNQSLQSKNPCDRIPDAKCRRLADEMLKGRMANKWHLSIAGGERLQWNDALHGFPLQVVEGGKVVMAMVYLAEEQVNGRKVERWRALQQKSNTLMESEQWYDPELNIAIRQRSQDGSYRELRNIQLGEQSESLFKVPPGYERVDANH
ncbi:MAG: hypothetical protein OEZ16_02105 [Chromatiales bacterium]|nr:hypothetical protein [Chromatiales bacterium]